MGLEEFNLILPVVRDSMIDALEQVLNHNGLPHGYINRGICQYLDSYAARTVRLVPEDPDVDVAGLVECIVDAIRIVAFKAVLPGWKYYSKDEVYPVRTPEGVSFYGCSRFEMWSSTHEYGRRRHQLCRLLLDYLQGMDTKALENAALGTYTANF